MVSPHVVADCHDHQLHLDADAVPRRHDRPQPRLPGRLLRRRRRRRAAVLQRLPGRRQRQPEQHRTRRPAVHLSGRERDRSALFHLRPAEPQRLADVGRHARAAAAELLLGQPRQQHPRPNTPAEHRLPQPERRLEHGRVDQPDEGLGPAHASRPASTPSTATSSRCRGARPADRALNFQQDAVGTNPCDTSFGFANAAIGCFSSYSQGSKGVEGEYIYYNIEGYVQDNWKVNRQLTLDYGVRLVHQTPQYDARGQASNFFPDKWTPIGGAGAVRRGLRQRRVSRAPAPTARR